MTSGDWITDTVAAIRHEIDDLLEQDIFYDTVTVGYSSGAWTLSFRWEPCCGRRTPIGEQCGVCGTHVGADFDTTVSGVTINADPEVMAMRVARAAHPTIRAAAEASDTAQKTDLELTAMRALADLATNGYRVGVPRPMSRIATPVPEPSIDGRFDPDYWATDPTYLACDSNGYDKGWALAYDQATKGVRLYAITESRFYSATLEASVTVPADMIDHATVITADEIRDAYPDENQYAAFIEWATGEGFIVHDRLIPGAWASLLDLATLRRIANGSEGRKAEI